VGLTAYLNRAGYTVVPFKKGPDYIDAGWLSQAAGRPCYNLDPYLMSPGLILQSFQRHAAGAEFCVIEGNRGLYDGVNAEGGYSTAELALQLGLPVLLVVNCSKTTRTVAAMVLGCREFDRRVNICGVILNQIATSRQEKVIRKAVELYTDIPVLGIVPRQRKDIFPMRHLGVVPHQETGSVQGAIGRLADMIGQNFAVSRIMDVMADISVVEKKSRPSAPAPAKVRIGVIRDRAFQFYYEENLEALQEAGAELVMIDALASDSLSDNIHGLYIGGGFPETSARELAENEKFRESVRLYAENGLPIYAECGGLIFLGRSLVIEGKEYPLAGVFPVSFGISKKPQAHGYSIFTVDRENPFYPVGTTIKGHEFRYSTVLQWDGSDEDLTLTMERGTGFMNSRDGLVKNNVLAMYTHVLAGGETRWASGIINTAGRYSRQRAGLSPEA
jgi:cobyrinic acid a,c-diamide synthase